MVKCQIQPNDVYDEAVLDVYRQVLREKFLPEAYKGVAYIDEDIKLPESHFLMDPTTHARLIQNIARDRYGLGLVIGCSYGYGVAILSHFCDTAIGLELSKDTVETATANLIDLDYTNTAIFKVDGLKNGFPDQSPYDIIIIEGAVSAIPDIIFHQMADNGKLLTVERKNSQSQGRAVCYLRQGNQYLKQTLFDANSQYIEGFEPRDEFVF